MSSTPPRDEPGSVPPGGSGGPAPVRDAGDTPVPDRGPASTRGPAPVRGVGNATATVRGVVFDLGGVLLRLADPLEIFELTLTDTEFPELWLRSPSVREFERGAIDARRFASSVVRELSLPMDEERFLERFNAWPKELFPDTPALLDAIPPGMQRVLLSNTNAEHWGRADISGALAGRFDLTFLSYRTGLLKPDREAFAQVVDACACEPGELLFFDDNPGNVAAAAEFGLQAHLVNGPAQALRVLERLPPTQEPAMRAPAAPSA